MERHLLHEAEAYVILFNILEKATTPSHATSHAQPRLSARPLPLEGPRGLATARKPSPMLTTMPVVSNKKYIYHEPNAFPPAICQRQCSTALRAVTRLENAAAARAARAAHVTHLAQCPNCLSCGVCVVGKMPHVQGRMNKLPVMPAMVPLPMRSTARTPALI